MIFPHKKCLFPALNGISFLNYAATSPLLKQSADKMNAVVNQGCEPLSMHFNTWLSLIESARKNVAETIGANSDEIAFTTSTSTALSLIANAIKWQNGDIIVFPADEFPSNRFVWENLKSKGVESHPIIPEPGVEFYEQLLTADLSRVRLVSFSSISYLDGRENDVKKIVALCHKKNILVAVDAIQSVGAMPVNVHAWGCDFLACGGQKWLLGPVGTGFLYIKSALLNHLYVTLVGWASHKNAGNHEDPFLEFVDGARRFEPGLLDVAAIAGLSQSIEILKSFGWENIFDAISNNKQNLVRNLANLGFDPITNGLPHAKSGIVTISFSDDNKFKKIVEECAKQKIILTQRNRQLRISAHAFTQKNELDSIVDLLYRYRKNNNPSIKKDLMTCYPIKNKKSNDDLKWQRALITGASSGLGEAIAGILAQRGCNLLLVGRNNSKLAVLANRLQQSYQIIVEVAIIDLANTLEIEKWIAEKQHNLSNIDVIINNAAMAEAGVFVESDVKQTRGLFEANYFMPILITRELLPFMIARKNGAILNIVTTGARCALPLFSSYAAAKGALWAWSESLGRELHGTGINVTTFLPPPMETAMQHRLGRKALAYYKIESLKKKNTSPILVAERAITALANKQPYYIPFLKKLEIALNVIFPKVLDRKISHRWRGI